MGDRLAAPPAAAATATLLLSWVQAPAPLGVIFHARRLSACTTPTLRASLVHACNLQFAPVQSSLPSLCCPDHPASCTFPTGAQQHMLGSEARGRPGQGNSTCGGLHPTTPPWALPSVSSLPPMIERRPCHPVKALSSASPSPSLEDASHLRPQVRACPIRMAVALGAAPASGCALPMSRAACTSSNPTGKGTCYAQMRFWRPQE